MVDSSKSAESNKVERRGNNQLGYSGAENLALLFCRCALSLADVCTDVMVMVSLYDTDQHRVLDVEELHRHISGLSYVANVFSTYSLFISSLICLVARTLVSAYEGIHLDSSHGKLRWVRYRYIHTHTAHTIPMRWYPL